MTAGDLKQYVEVHPRTGAEFINVGLTDEWFGRKPFYEDDEGNEKQVTLDMEKHEAMRLILAGRAEPTKKRKRGRPSGSTKSEVKKAPAPENKMVQPTENK